MTDEVTSEEVDEPVWGSLTAEPTGPQQLPDSAGSEGKQVCFPTGAKERERERRTAQEVAGQKHKVKKRKVIIEDHWDDCG